MPFFVSITFSAVWHNWVLLAKEWTDKLWTDIGHEIQPLSKVQGLSIGCPPKNTMSVWTLSKKLSLDRDWTWKSKVCPAAVSQTLAISSITKLGQTLDVDKLWS